MVGGGEAGLMGMEEIQMLAAFAKQQMTKSHSVRLSDLDPSQWGCIRKNAGARHEVQSSSCDYDGPEGTCGSIAASFPEVVLCVPGSFSNPTLGRSVASSCSHQHHFNGVRHQRRLKQVNICLILAVISKQSSVTRSIVCVMLGDSRTC